MKKLYALIVFPALFTLLLANSFAQAPNTWTQKANYGGSFSQFSVGFSIGSKGYLGTGQIGSNYYANGFWEYNPSTDTWTQKANFGGAERNYAVGFSIGNKGYIGTGATISGYTNDFWEYDPSANTWTQKANFGGTARTEAVGFSIGSKGYIGTGTSINGLTNDFWEYDPSANTWTQKANFGGTARQGSAGFSIGAKGYIGTGWDGTLKNDFWEFNPSANTWTLKAGFGGTARQGSSGFGIGAKGYIGTGWDGDLKNDFWEYDPSANTWTIKAVFGGTGRDFASGFTIGTYGFIGTGEQYGGPANDFWEYTPSCILPGPPVNTTPIANQTACSGSTTTLSASGSGILGWYSASPGGNWMGGGTNFTTPILTTSTTFYVQDSTCGASSARTGIAVTVNPSPAAAAGANRAICLNASTQIGASPVAGNTYSWTSVPAGFVSTLANPIVTPLVTTTYTLTETNPVTGCSNSHSVVVTVNPLPAAVAGANRTICQNVSTQIGAAPAAGHSYSWTSVPAGYNSALSNPTVTPLVTTTYTLVETVTTTGCTNSNSVVVTVNPAPAANAGASTAICLNLNTQIGAAPVGGNTYNWTSVPAGFTSIVSNPTVTPLITTTYSLTETITATGCFNTNSVVVTVNPLPAANAGTNRTICLNSNTQLGASPVAGHTYSWTSVPAGFTSTLANPVVSPAGITTYTLTETNTATGCINSNSVVVSINPLPAAVAGLNRVICQNASTQIGAASVAGSTYSWTSVPAGFTSTLGNPTVTPLVTTTYTVIETITATGCTNSNSVVVTVNPAPAANAGANRAICLNANTQIGATPVAGNVYSWTSSPVGYTSTLANPVVSPLSNTTYTLTETNTVTGCINTNSIVVTVNPLPAAVAGLNRSICLNANTQIGSAPAPGHTYSWTSVPAGYTSASANPTVSPLVTTTYFLTETITATGCSNSNSVVITVNPSPAANAGANRAICLNASTQIGAAPVAGNTYSWTSVPAGFTSILSNPTVAPLVSTTYTLAETITATGCTNINSVVVTVNPLPVANAGANRAICLNASTQIGAAPVVGNTYSWTSIPAGFTSTLANPIVSPLLTTSYFLTETFTASGCSNSNSMVVTVNPLPAAVAGTNRVICQNDNTQIGSAAVAGNTYSWTSVPAGFTSPISNPVVTPLVTTTFTITETITATGCTNSNSVVVTVNPAPAANAGTNRAICLNASTQIGSNPVAGNTYSWASVPAGFSSTLANPVVSPLSLTTYTLTETNTVTGCSNTNSVVVTVTPLPAAVAGANRVICQNDNTQIGSIPVAGNTYSWTSVPAGFTSTLANPTVSPLVSTTYTVTETIQATGCTNSNSVVVTVNPAPAANAGVSRSICLNTNTQIGTDAVAGNIYSWTSVPAGYTSILANPLVAPIVTTTYTLTETNTTTGCTNTNSVVVTVNPLPAAVAGTNKSVCLNLNTQIGSAPVSGHTYSWTSIPAGYNSTLANPIVTPLLTTTYILTETITATGCTNSNNVVVTVNPLPAAYAGANTIICQHASIQLGSTPVPGNTYGWTSVPAGFASTLANPIVTPLVTTTYILTETITATGCINSNSVVVTVNPLPAANAGVTRAICLHDSTQIGSAPVPGNTYTWSSVPAGFISTSANPFVTPLVTTTYTLTETNSATGCTNTNSMVVTVNPLPAAVAGINRTVCRNVSTQIGSPPAPGHTYSWTSIPAGFTSTSANPTVSPLVNTIYTVTETITATGCSNSNSVLVTVNPLPAANAGINRAICLHDSTQLGSAPVPGSTYSWTSIPAGFNSTSANPTVTPSGTTTYTLTETFTATGCVNSNSVVVTVNPLPSANAGANRAVCLNASTQIGSAPVPGNTYIWTSVPAGFTSTSANPTVTPLVTTIFTLSETITATGCTNSHSVVVSVNPLPAANAGANRAICLHDSTQLGSAAVPGNTYSWTSVPAGFTSALANPVVNPTLTTTYTLTETITATGCTNSHSVVVTVNPLPGANAGANRAICMNVSTQIGSAPVPGHTYSWTSVPAGFVSTSADPTVTPLLSTVYTLTETITATGCINSNSMVVTVNPLPAAIAGVNRAICQNGSTQIGSAPINGNTYNWTSAPAGFNSTLANPVVMPLVTTIYSLTETITATGCLNTNSVVVTVNPSPVPSISGPGSACAGTSGNNYTTQGGMSNYQWIVSSGGTILSGPGTSSIQVRWDSAGARFVTVNYANSFGCSALTPSLESVTVYPLPVPSITGPDSLCMNAAGTYSTETGMNNYQWTVSPGGNIVSGSGTSAIHVNWTAAGPQTVSVSYRNGNNCTAAVPADFNVTVNPLPAANAGANTAVCLHDSIQIGSAPIPGSTYIWTSVPAGFTSTLANPTVAPLVSTTYTVTETITATGCTNSHSIVVTVHPLPSPSISGPSALCAGVYGIDYTTQAGMSNYQWNISSGGTITSGLGTASVQVRWDSAGARFVTVNYANSFGCFAQAPAVKNVTVYPLPAPTVTGPDSLCLNATGTYITESGMSNYQWIISPGGSSATGLGTNTLHVTWTTSGPRFVSVNYTNPNNCTAASPTVYNVDVFPLPVPTITGISNVCANETGVIYVTESGMSNYVWSISTGSTINSGQGTDLVSVTWGNAGSGTVSVTYTSAVGCNPVTATTKTVTILPRPLPTISGSSSVCINSGPKTYFTEGGQQNYLWNISSGDTILGGLGTSSVTVQWKSAGNRWISVTYSSPSGCQAAIPDTLNVTVDPVPGAASTISGPALLCVPAFWQEYSIDTIVNAGGYYWTLPAGAIFQGTSNSNIIHVAYLQNAQSGNITVYGTNACGNGTPSSLYVTLRPVPEKPLISLHQNDTLVSSSLYGNQWYFNNQLLPGDTLDHLHAVLTGDYFTIVTLGNCSSDTSNIIFVIAVGLREDPKFSVSIHPNPTTGMLVVDFASPCDKNYKVILINEVGVIIQESEGMVTKGKYSWIIDLGNLSPGPYFLMIQSPEGIIRKKIIKK